MYEEKKEITYRLDSSKLGDKKCEAILKWLDEQIELGRFEFSDFSEVEDEARVFNPDFSNVFVLVYKLNKSSVLYTVVEVKEIEIEDETDDKIKFYLDIKYSQDMGNRQHIPFPYTRESYIQYLNDNFSNTADEMIEPLLNSLLDHIISKYQHDKFHEDMSDFLNNEGEFHIDDDILEMLEKGELHKED